MTNYDLYEWEWVQQFNAFLSCCEKNGCAAGFILWVACVHLILNQCSLIYKLDATNELSKTYKTIIKNNKVMLIY